MAVMLEKLTRYVTWPIVALAALVVGAAVAIVLLAPPDVREWLLGANGIVAMVIAYLMHSPRESRLDRTLSRTEATSRRADELIAQYPSDETWPKGRE